MTRRRLPAYLRRRVGVQILALLAVLTALMQLLELLDVTTEVLDRGQGLLQVGYYALLRSPAELVLALPLSVLLGTMTALHAMARGMEITAMRVSGLSMMRLLRHLMPTVLLLALAQVALQQWVLPETQTALKQWWNAGAPPDKTRARLWAHTNDGLIAIDDLSADARLLKGVRVYVTDASGLISERMSATEARWENRRWLLSNVSELHVDGPQPRRVQETSREWKVNLRPGDVLLLDESRPNLSSIMLADVIDGSRAGTQPRSYYMTVLYRSFTAPLGVFIMLLLALPIAWMQPRSSGGGREMLIVLVLGLAFLLCDGMVAALGTSGMLPPLATALVAPVVFIAIGFWRLRACERL